MTPHADPPSEHEPELVLAGDFPTPTMTQWQDAVAKVLNRGRPDDRQFTGDQAISRLRTSTVDGLTIEPIAVSADDPRPLGAPGVPPFTRGTTVRRGEMDAWDVRALHEDPDPAFTREAIRNDLERGVTSLWLRIDPDAISATDLATDLADVILDLAKVEVTSRTDQRAAAEALLTVFDGSDAPKESLSLNLGIDPIGYAALTGEAADLSELPDWVRRLDGYKRSRALVSDATIWHNAGAGDVHEAAWAIATATEYVRALIDAGVSPDDAFDAINFRVTATCDQFATIARLRALRTCWHRVGEVLGVSESRRGARQHVVTSWRETSRDDPYVNMLRGTISTFSAAIGGAEAITTLPFDTAWGLPGAFSRRIARNTQVVLAEESNIGRVNDPGGGSWYLEQLTEAIAEAAWQEFQTVEGRGGMAAALADGYVEQALATLNEERRRRLAYRSKPITGVSEFPKPDEEALNTRPRPQAPERGGLRWQRDAELFEQLRDRTAQAATSGQAPTVFLACLGARRDFGPREGFAANLFQVAGLATPRCEGGTVEEVVAAWQAAQTPVVCLCSSGRVYAEQAIPVAQALRAAGAQHVLLAGNIREVGDVEDGVFDGTIAMGMDVVDILETTLATLGVDQ